MPEDTQNEAEIIIRTPISPLEEELHRSLMLQTEEIDLQDEHGNPRLDQGEPSISQEAEWARTMPNRWMVIYLLRLQQTSNPTLARRAAKVSQVTVDKYSKLVPEFGRAIREAKQAAVDLIEASVFASATTGDLEPIFNKQRGKIIGYIRKKSMDAARLLLEAERPEKFRKEYEAPQNQTIILQTPEAIADVVRRAMPVLAGEKVANAKVVELVKED